MTQTHLGYLWRQNQALLGDALERRLGDVRADLVDGAAFVLARVLLVAVQDVEDDDAEVVERAEAVATRQLLAVAVPLHL